MELKKNEATGCRTTMGEIGLSGKKDREQTEQTLGITP
jgi:hypothetical protein